MRKLLGLIFLLLFALPAWAELGEPAASGAAEPFIALVVKQEGRAKLLRHGEVRKRRAENGQQLFPGDMLITSAGAMLELRMFDGSTVILNGDSRLTFISPNELDQGEGSVYYNIRPRLVDRQLSVKTEFVVIGVKGTTFVVATRADDRRVSMKEGLVGVEALVGEFELYREKELDEFQRYQQQQLKEFEEYKAKQQREFVAFVREFELAASRTVSFDDNKAYEQANDEAVEAEFNRFEEFFARPPEPPEIPE